MANEISTATATGRTLYAVVRNSAGQVWNTLSVAFEAYTSANWPHYGVALAEQGASGFYTAGFPSAIAAAGLYGIDVRVQASTSPAPSDSALAGGTLVWTGSAESFVLADTQGRPTIAGYAAGQDPASLVLGTPANKVLTDSSGRVSVASYATGQDPASLVLSVPANKLLTNASGQVDVDWSQAIPAGASGLTLGRAALAAIAEGVGVWKYDPLARTLQEYAEDGTTLLRSFALTIDASGTITQRT